MYPLESPGKSRVVNQIGKGIFTARNLPPVDGCVMTASTVALPLPFWQPRVFLNIVFYEWRDETNELIIAGTSEQTDEVERANGHLLTGRNILGFTFDDFHKFSFTSEGVQYDYFRFGDPRGTVGKHAPAEWLRDPQPTFDFFKALQNDYLRRPN